MTRMATVRDKAWGAGRFPTSIHPTPRTAGAVTKANAASASSQALPGLSRATDLPRTRPTAVSSVAARAAGTTLFSTPAPIQSPTCPNPVPAQRAPSEADDGEHRSGRCRPAAQRGQPAEAAEPERWPLLAAQAQHGERAPRADAALDGKQRQ